LKSVFGISQLFIINFKGGKAMFKKHVVKLFLLSLILSSFIITAACGTGTAQPDIQESTTAAGELARQAMNPAGILPIVTEPVTLSVFSGARPGIDFETNLAALEFERLTGVNINWMQVPDADRVTRQNLMLATGDYPEILMVWGDVGSHAMIYHHAQMGMFRPITYYIERYAPNLQRLFEAHPYVRDDMIMPDGHIYGFPAIDDCFHCSMNQKMWIYRPWLDALDLDMPTTTDELLYVLRAFRDRDPNGNGIQDIIPMLGATGHIRSEVDIILTSFITSDGANRLQVRDGNIIPIFDTPEWRDGLRFLNQLYREGLLSSYTFVLDRGAQRPIGDNPDHNRVGVKLAFWIGATVTVDHEDQDGRWTGWELIPPLMGPNGHQEALFVPLRGNHRAVITDALPEEMMPIAVRWLDNFLDPEVALTMTLGIEGKNWRRAEPGEVGIDGGPASWAMIRGEDTPENAAMGQLVNWRPHDLRMGEVANRDIIEIETRLYDSTLLQLPYRQSIDNIVPVLVFDETQTAEIVDFQTNINQFVFESIARFTVGDLDIENDWDWYLRELELMGLSRYIEIMQQAFDARAEVLANR